MSTEDIYTIPSLKSQDRTVFDLLASDSMQAKYQKEIEVSMVQ